MIRLLAINTQSPLSNLLRFVVIFTLTLILLPIGALAESGILFHHAQNGGRPIEDDGGDSGRTIWEIDLSGAPANAVIASVDVEYWITHPFVGDLKVWLATEHNGKWKEYLLWDLEGENNYDIHEKETVLTIWNGLSANRKWYLCAADFAEEDEGEISEWKIWVRYKTGTVTPQDSIYSQDFSLGKPSTTEGWEYYSNNEGRIEVLNGQLRMDDRIDSSAYSLNEAILHLDLSGRSGVTLTLDHLSNRDENDSLPTSFTGHMNGDGIAISTDGIHWYLLTNLTSDFKDWSFDLDDAMQSAGISDTSDFRIKFQQYDNYSWSDDGRAFDNISITANGGGIPPFVNPFGIWNGTYNSTNYGTSGTISDWIIRDDYITESMWELDIGSKTGIRINPSGTYFFNPLNGHLDFSYSGLATVWVDRQTTDLPCIFDVNGTVFPDDNASGSYLVSFFPPNLLPFVDSGTWQATRVPNIILHIFGIEICTGWNHNDPDKSSDTTYEFRFALETDNSVSDVEFLTPAGSIFQIPNDFYTKSDNIETWHYATETSPLDMPPTDLAAHWKMDDNVATTTVVDCSDRGHHGTTKRHTTALTTVGMIDNALSFNGISDYISVPDNADWTFSDDFTIALWVKFNTFNPKWWESAFIGHDEGPYQANKWIFSYDTGDSKTLFHINYPGANGPIIKGNQWAAQAGVWYFIAVTRSGSTYTFYREGISDGAQSDGTAIPDASAPLTIGWAEEYATFDGALDDVRIYNKALSDVEIKALFDRKKKNAERWEYIGKFTNSYALKQYGDGTYIITVHHKDGKQNQTTAWFGIPETYNAIPQPTQEPLLNFPKHNGKAISPVIFMLEPCSDTKATTTGLCLEKVGSDEDCLVNIELPVTATSSDPITLGPGIWQAKIFCDHWYNYYNNIDDIAVEVGKFSESNYRFEVSEISPDIPDKPDIPDIPDKPDIPDTAILNAHWKMDDNAATTTVVDSSGRSNHGTAVRNTSALSVAGPINRALAFNGISDYISVPDNADWTFSGDFTITLWVKFNTFNPKWWESAFIGHDEGPGHTNKWIFSYDPVDNKTLFHINRAGKSGPFIKADPWIAQAGLWYFLAVARNGSTYTFYREGISDGVRINGTVIPNASAPLTIGWAEGYAAFDGALDDVRIYNKVLSETEIKALFDEQNLDGQQGPNDGNGTGQSLIEQTTEEIPIEQEGEEPDEEPVIIIWPFP